MLPLVLVDNLNPLYSSVNKLVIVSHSIVPGPFAVKLISNNVELFGRLMFDWLYHDTLILPFTRFELRPLNRGWILERLTYVSPLLGTRLKVIAATLVNELDTTGIVMDEIGEFGQILVLPIVSAIGLPGITSRVASKDIDGDPQFAVTIQRNLLRCKAVVAALTCRIFVFVPLNNALLVMLIKGPLLTDLCHW